MDQNSKEKKLFFFGQPGCLNVQFNIPIRTSSESQSDTEERANSEENSENATNNENDTNKKSESTSDDDGAELLKKIDEVLEDEGKSKDHNEETPSKNIVLKEPSQASEENEKKAESCENSDETKSESALEIVSSITNDENVNSVKSVEIVESNNDKSSLVIDECQAVDTVTESSPKSVENSENLDKSLPSESFSNEIEESKCKEENLKELPQTCQEISLKESEDASKDEEQPATENSNENSESVKCDVDEVSVEISSGQCESLEKVDTQISVENASEISEPTCSEPSEKIENSEKISDTVEAVPQIEPKSPSQTQSSELEIVEKEPETSTINEELPHTQGDDLPESVVPEIKEQENVLQELDESESIDDQKQKVLQQLDEPMEIDQESTSQQTVENFEPQETTVINENIDDTVVPQSFEESRIEDQSINTQNDKSNEIKIIESQDQDAQVVPDQISKEGESSDFVETEQDNSIKNIPQEINESIEVVPSTSTADHQSKESIKESDIALDEIKEIETQNTEFLETDKIEEPLPLEKESLEVESTVCEDTPILEAVSSNSENNLENENAKIENSTDIEMESPEKEQSLETKDEVVEMEQSISETGDQNIESQEQLNDQQVITDQNIVETNEVEHSPVEEAQPENENILDKQKVAETHLEVPTDKEVEHPLEKDESCNQEDVDKEIAISENLSQECSETTEKIEENLPETLQCQEEAVIPECKDNFDEQMCTENQTDLEIINTEEPSCNEPIEIKNNEFSEEACEVKKEESVLNESISNKLTDVDQNSSSSTNEEVTPVPEECNIQEIEMAEESQEHVTQFIPESIIEENKEGEILETPESPQMVENKSSETEIEQTACKSQENVKEISESDPKDDDSMMEVESIKSIEENDNLCEKEDLKSNNEQITEIPNEESNQIAMDVTTQNQNEESKSEEHKIVEIIEPACKQLEPLNETKSQTDIEDNQSTEDITKIEDEACSVESIVKEQSPSETVDVEQVPSIVEPSNEEPESPHLTENKLPENEINEEKIVSNEESKSSTDEEILACNSLVVNESETNVNLSERNESSSLTESLIHKNYQSNDDLIEKCSERETPKESTSENELSIAPENDKNSEEIYFEKSSITIESETSNEETEIQNSSKIPDIQIESPRSTIDNDISNDVEELKMEKMSETEKINDSCITTNENTEEIEKIVPQKLITVEENLNEKINDNQVALSKIDNKSFSLEKVSTSENIDIKNEISADLNKIDAPSVEERKDLGENNSVLQIHSEIQPQSNEIIVEKNQVQEETIGIEVKSQQEKESTDEDSIKLSIDTKSEECKVVEQVTENVEKVTEKMILNEMAQNEACTSDGKIKSNELDVHEDLIEPNSNEIIQESINEIQKHENKIEIIENKDDSSETPTCSIAIDSERKVIETQDLKNTEIKDTSVEAVTVNEPQVELSTGTKEAPKSPQNDATVDDVQPPVDPLEQTNSESKSFDDLLDNKKAQLESIPITKSFAKPVITRKRKLSERKSISESDSDGGSHFVTDSVSCEKSSDEETVATKKPRIRNKITATRNTRATRQSARGVQEEPKPVVEKKVQKKTDVEEKKEEKTLQSLKFDFDENEDVAANMAAIKSLIKSKETPKKTEDDDEDDDSNDSSDGEDVKKKPVRRGRKGKRGRVAKKENDDESSSDESKSAKVPESKRSKTSESEETSVEKRQRKRRDPAAKGLLKHLDTSLVIETIETETPVRQSRRIAQQKIREETERRQMEEKMLKQMKEEAERKKKMAFISEPADEEEPDDSSDESYKDSKKKKKKNIKPIDKQWQTSSSHSERSESEDEFERPPSEDPGSPLFRSDHEFSPESDVDDAPVQPVKRARTAKKQVEESSDDEDVNPNHACQVCHKTDCPEWILLCDECDHGYHCSCLKPIIFCIPSGNWYCPLCCHKKLIDNLTVQLDKLDTLITNIKAEEIRQQKQLEIKKLTEITEENILNDRRKNRSEQKIKQEKARDSKTRDATSEQESGSDDDESSDNSSDNEPLNEYFYKLRRRNQTTTSYRFNDYDDLINSAIRDEMEEVKGMGNAGRGKDISTIIEADKEEKKQLKLEKEREEAGHEKKEKENDQEGEESSGSDVIRPKKSAQRKKKNRKLNNLDETSEEDQNSDEDFKGVASSNSDTDEEYSVSGSVSESSLDLPSKKSKVGPRSTRNAARNRRYDETFIDDNSSDDEPLIKKRTKKQIDSDEDEFDANEENSDGSTAEDIDSEDLCDDTDTDDSSESNWPRKRKKKAASYDTKKPRKPAKKNDGDNDKAFRAGISKKKVVKQSDNESEGSDNDSADKGRRRTRGKKLLYLIEDDYESDDGIKPGIGVVRPETPPEERELFFKKQEEIKRMLAEKNTEAARQLAVPTIEPLKIALEMPKSPSPPPLTSSELESLSTIPKNVIEGAKALDMDYNKIKSINFGNQSKSNEHPSAHDMSEEDLARMMEEEDFAQHQLKLVGESLKNKLLDLDVKEEAFAGFSKGNKLKQDEKDLEKVQPPETKKKTRKVKSEKQPNESAPSTPIKIQQPESSSQTNNSPKHVVPTSLNSVNELNKPPGLVANIPSVPPLISNPISHQPYPNIPQRFAGQHSMNVQDRPSVLSSLMQRHESLSSRLEVMQPRLEGMPPRFEGMHPRLEGLPPRLEGMRPRLEPMPQRLESLPQRFEGLHPRLAGMHPRLEVMSSRLEGMRPRFEGMPPRLESMRMEGAPPQHLRFPQPPSESFHPKTQPPMPHLQAQRATEEQPEEKKKGRRKKYTPLRTDLPESNVSKVAKLDPPATSSVIQASTNLSPDRVDDKAKISLPPLQRAKATSNAPEIFNPATNSTSVITRLLQPQQRPPFGGFVEQINAPVSSPNNPNQSPTSRPFPEDMKHHPVSKQARPGPQPQFTENPFVRGMHPLYRGPPTSQPSIYGIPSHHARIPYSFHHLHPNNNLRPNIQEYGAPYNIPPQFGYYAPPAHSRQHPSNPSAHPDHSAEVPPNSARPTGSANPDEQSESSEFGGLVSYFSSQQELD